MDTESQISLNNCPICLNSIDELNKCIMSCNHVFCRECIHKWFDKKKISCPNCRDEIKSYQNNNRMNYLVKVEIPNENQRNIILLNNELSKKLLLMRIFLIINFIYLIYSLFEINLKNDEEYYYQHLYENCSIELLRKKEIYTNKLQLITDQYNSYTNIPVYIEEKIYQCSFPAYFIQKCLSYVI